MVEKVFPILYKKTSTGKLNQWTIKVAEVEGGNASIIIVRGAIGDKIQSNERLITKGKNINKKNETTPWQQACKDAQSKWNHKKDREGYTVTKGEAETNVIVKPMLAHKYIEHMLKMKFPCYIQPKLNGVRGLGCPDSTILSRQNMKYLWLDHIREDISRMITGKEHLDGELFVHPSVMSQQTLSGLCRYKDRPTEEQMEQLKLVEYHVYDFFDLNKMDMTFEERYEILKKKFNQGTYKSIRLVETKELKDRGNVQKEHDIYTNKGYEGMMFRNKDGLYKLARRSCDLMKYKSF